MSRPSNRELILGLRHRAQVCESRTRLALVGATELRARLDDLGMVLEIRRLSEFEPVRQLAARLQRLLAGEEGGEAC